MAANIQDKLIERVRGLPADEQQRVLEFVEQLGTQRGEDNGRSAQDGHLTLWDIVNDVINEVPLEAWEDVPKDGSVNV